MPFYMFTGRYSTEAFKAMVANPQDREAAGRALVESVGGKLHNLFFAFGENDIVALIEGPDDQTAAAAAMTLAASGALSGGATTKLMTTAEAKEAMTKAQGALKDYQSPLR